MTNLKGAKSISVDQKRKLISFPTAWTQNVIASQSYMAWLCTTQSPTGEWEHNT